MSGYGTFGLFRSLARARPPSAGKISASAALSASARRTPRSVAADDVRPEDGLPIRTADICAPASIGMSTERYATMRAGRRRYVPWPGDGAFPGLLPELRRCSPAPDPGHGTVQAPYGNREGSDGPESN